MAEPKRHKDVPQGAFFGKGSLTGAYAKTSRLGGKKEEDRLSHRSCS
jgi:hypothetical protein